MEGTDSGMVEHPEHGAMEQEDVFSIIEVGFRRGNELRIFR
jgi:hypothetical protein